MDNTIVAWDQEVLMQYDGNDDGLISEEEFINAATEQSEGSVTEKQAKDWYQQLQADIGQEGEDINFDVLTSDQMTTASQRMQAQFFDMNDEWSLTNEDVFDKIDTNGDGEINKEEWDVYVDNHMPGGDALDPEMKQYMFNMIANPNAESEGEGMDVISRDEFNNAGELLEDMQAVVETNTITPKTPEEKMLEALDALIQQLEEQAQNDFSDLNY